MGDTPEVCGWVTPLRCEMTRVTRWLLHLRLPSSQMLCQAVRKQQVGVTAAAREVRGPGGEHEARCQGPGRLSTPRGVTLSSVFLQGLKDWGCRFKPASRGARWTPPERECPVDSQNPENPGRWSGSFMLQLGGNAALKSCLFDCMSTTFPAPRNPGPCPVKTSEHCCWDSWRPLQCIVTHKHGQSCDNTLISHS